ncbi:MAG: YkgJ family cysteine cluster protein [Polyangiaceae bacterium]
MDAIGFDRARFIGDERAAAASLLARDATPQGLARVAERAANVAGEVLAHHLQVIPPNPPIACGSGCAFCCYLRAEITMAEAERLADHLRRTRSADELAEVRARVEENASRVASLGTDARAEARIPCALLVDARCSVYEARPLTCRGCNSSSMKDCEESLADASVETTVYAPQTALYRYAHAALVAALSGAGADGAQRELHQALALALAAR